MRLFETDDAISAENVAAPVSDGIVGRKKPLSAAGKPAATGCDRCGSIRSEQMVRAAHIVLYKCADCGWRYGRCDRT
jgi:predicted RNA-binding Zn-ribbon protein involved in translation (DUF1610 family)